MGLDAESTTIPLEPGQSVETPGQGVRQIGPFRLLELIGEGSYGVVWRAEHVALGRQAAVKVLHSRHLANAASTARFLREAQLAARLKHPCVPAVYDVGVEADGARWIAMELMPGHTLSAHISAAGPMSPAEWLPCCHQLADALGQAHRLGIVHRDLAPANVMVTRGDGGLTPTLLDLGLARCVQEESEIGTRSGAGMGTPGFAAPEQWDDAATVGPAADQYALARLTIFVLTGRTPGTRSVYDALHRVGMRLPAAVTAVLARAESPLPADRFESVGAFAEALDAALRGAAALAERVAAAPEVSEAPVTPALGGLGSFEGHFASGSVLEDLRGACASVLYQRTAGEERWAPGELERARRRRFVRLDVRGEWRADAEGLCAWRLNPPERAVRTSVERVPELGADAACLLGALSLAGGELDRALVVGPHLPPERVEPALRELEQRARARRVPDSTLLVAAPNTRPPTSWRPEAVTALHRAVMERGIEATEPGTLRQGWRAALLTRDPGRIVLATKRLTHRLMETDGLVEATLAVWTAVERIGLQPAYAEQLVPLATDLVLNEPTAARIASLRGWLTQLGTPVAARALLLLETRDRYVAGDVAPTGALAPAVPDLGEPALMAHLFRMRMDAALRRALHEADAVLAEMERWMVGRWGDPDLHAAFLRISAFCAYRRRQFNEAASLSYEAASRARRLDHQVEAMLAGAFAHLELGRYGSARELGEKARVAASRMHSPVRLARAMRVSRDAMFRSGAPIRPDLELVAATQTLQPVYVAHHALAEAAIAWRAGDLGLARRLSESAERRYTTAQTPGPALLCAALRAASRGRGPPSDVGALRGRCLDLAQTALSHSDPVLASLVCQALGLLSDGGGSADLRPLLTQLVASLPAARHHLPLEVLSIDEALSRIDGATASPHPGVIR